MNSELTPLLSTGCVDQSEDLARVTAQRDAARNALTVAYGSLMSAATTMHKTSPFRRQIEADAELCRLASLAACGDTQ